MSMSLNTELILFAIYGKSLTSRYELDLLVNCVNISFTPFTDTSKGIIANYSPFLVSPDNDRLAGRV